MQPDRVVVDDEAGTWTIWWQPGAHVVGAIGRFVRAGAQAALVDDRAVEAPLNTPRVGGLGGFGFHEAVRAGCCDGRDVAGSAAEITGDHAWNVDDRHPGPFGVSWVRHTRPRLAGGRLHFAVVVGIGDLRHATVLAARYDWSFGRWDALLHLRVWEDGDAATFVKEPKVALSLRDVYPHLSVFHEWLPVDQCNVDGLPPANRLRSSCQLQESHAVVRFDDGLGGCGSRRCFAVAIDAGGLARWARLSDGRACFATVGHRSIDAASSCDTGSAGGCLRAGLLPQQWELHRLNGWEQLLVAGWTGGSGAYDCAVASRRFGPRGENFGVTMRFLP